MRMRLWPAERARADEIMAGRPRGTRAPGAQGLSHCTGLANAGSEKLGGHGPWPPFSDVYICIIMRARACVSALQLASLETRPSPSSTRACSVSYNYAWEYFRRQKAWYILSRDACRDCHKASSCGAVT